MDGRHIGRGTSTDESVAFEKATSEALERLVCFENDISTEGVAAFPSESGARQNATLEALERELFRYHLENKISFYSAQPSESVDGISAALDSYGASISWMKMHTLPPYESSVCLVKKDDRFFLGLGFGENSSEVQLHSAIEALRNFAAYNENPKRFLEQVELNSDLWNCSDNFFDKNKNVFQDVSLPSSTVFKIDKIPIKIQSIRSTSSLEIPLHFAQAKVTGGFR